MLMDKKHDVEALTDISLEEVDFFDSSFFLSGKSCSPRLPSPTSVIQQYGDGGRRVVKIEAQNLAIKIDFAPSLKLEEVQTMRAISQAFQNDEIPVPEVFGWKKTTLREAWSLLSHGDKVSIQTDLCNIVASLRRLRQDSPNVIASINRGTVQDRFFRLDCEKGPFTTIKAFNDWISAAATRQIPGTDGPTGLNHPHMYRDLLPDTGDIYFTHRDLTLGNIIVSGDAGAYKVQGIIDWEQAGWYPEHWECSKMLFGVDYEHEWRTDNWPVKITKAFEEAFFAFAEYSV